MTSQFVGVKEASEILGVHHMTIRNWVRTEELPSRRIGRRVLIPRAAVEARADPVAQDTSPDVGLPLRQAPMMELLAEAMRTNRPVLGHATDQDGRLVWFDGGSSANMAPRQRLEDHIAELEAILGCPDLPEVHRRSIARLLQTLRQVVEGDGERSE